MYFSQEECIINVSSGNAFPWGKREPEWSSGEGASLKTRRLVSSSTLGMKARWETLGQLCFISPTHLVIVIVRKIGGARNIKHVHLTLLIKIIKV